MERKLYRVGDCITYAVASLVAMVSARRTLDLVAAAATGYGAKWLLSNHFLVTIFYSKLNTFRRLFGPPFTIAKGY